MPSLAKDTKINGVEDLMIKLELDPSDINAAEEIIKSKNAYIQAWRKKLKLPTTEHPQVQEVRQLEKEKENMLCMIVE